MAAFSLRLNLAMEVNRHFLKNEYGDLSFFFSVVLKFFYVKKKYGPILSVEQQTIVENVNLATNRDYSIMVQYHGTIIRIYME